MKSSQLFNPKNQNHLRNRKSLRRRNRQWLNRKRRRRQKRMKPRILLNNRRIKITIRFQKQFSTSFLLTAIECITTKMLTKKILNSFMIVSVAILLSPSAEGHLCSTTMTLPRPVNGCSMKVKNRNRKILRYTRRWITSFQQKQKSPAISNKKILKDPLKLL